MFHCVFLCGAIKKQNKKNVISDMFSTNCLFFSPKSRFHVSNDFAIIKPPFSQR